MYGQTDVRTDGQMDVQTDKASYRDALPYIKMHVNDIYVHDRKRNWRRRRLKLLLLLLLIRSEVEKDE